MDYSAPVKDGVCNLQYLARLRELADAVPAFADAGVDTAQAVLEECARFAEGVLAPLNRAGDLEPAAWGAGDLRAGLRAGQARIAGYLLQGPRGAAPLVELLACRRAPA